MRIATFNLQNLKLLKSADGPQLHGAWDSDDPEETGLDAIDRRLTAEVLAKIDADLLALQEVYDLATLEHFYQRFMLPAGLGPYPERICLPGNDGRGLDLALLSRRPLDELRSHAALTLDDFDIAPPPGVDPLAPVFRRDCLMATAGQLTLFLCHFKSPYPDVATAWTTRRLEALAVRRLIERYFETAAAGLWLIVGDLNEPHGALPGAERAIAPLENGFTVNLMERLPEPERWTYFDVHSGRYDCPDVLLASPALAQAFPQAVPVILRAGLGREAQRDTSARLSGVGQHRPHASDHAAVMIDLPGL